MFAIIYWAKNLLNKLQGMLQKCTEKNENLLLITYLVN